MRFLNFEILGKSEIHESRSSLGRFRFCAQTSRNFLRLHLWRSRWVNNRFWVWVPPKNLFVSSCDGEHFLRFEGTDVSMRIRCRTHTLPIQMCNALCFPKKLHEGHVRKSTTRCCLVKRNIRNMLAAVVFLAHLQGAHLYFVCKVSSSFWCWTLFHPDRESPTLLF